MNAGLFAEVDRLGPVLALLGHQRVNLTWDRSDGYSVDGRTSDGRYFCGFGPTPSAALANAEGWDDRVSVLNQRRVA